mmetsp:Transcript_25216/g.75923  ORF Transcript_25216/g.75923 Transcript_25216/m.75923 type:complete len:214 (+) Transcript_25216:1015-1656(+)
MAGPYCVRSTSLPCGNLGCQTHQVCTVDHELAAMLSLLPTMAHFQQTTSAPLWPTLVATAAATPLCTWSVVCMQFIADHLGRNPPTDHFGPTLADSTARSTQWVHRQSSTPQFALEPTEHPDHNVDHPNLGRWNSRQNGGERGGQDPLGAFEDAVCAEHNLGGKRHHLIWNQLSDRRSHRRRRRRRPVHCRTCLGATNAVIPPFKRTGSYCSD